MKKLSTLRVPTPGFAGSDSEALGSIFYGNRRKTAESRLLICDSCQIICFFGRIFLENDGKAKILWYNEIKAGKNSRALF